MAATFKTKTAGQRACNEKDAKGEFCVGHLKRWYYPAGSDIAKELGAGQEIYRCERCHTLYRAAPKDDSTAGRRFVAQPVNIFGDTEVKRS